MHVCAQTPRCCVKRFPIIKYKIIKRFSVVPFWIKCLIQGRLRFSSQFYIITKGNFSNAYRRMKLWKFKLKRRSTIKMEVWILCNSFWTWDRFTVDKQFWTGRDAFRYKANKGDHIASCQGNVYYTSLKKVRDTIMELCLSVSSIQYHGILRGNKETIYYDINIRRMV